MQLKKVEYKDNGHRPNNFGRLNLTFHNPPEQFFLVVKLPDFFYCLPTFVNRDLRRQAIHHCLFLRPKSTDSRDLSALYENDSALTPHESINQAPRWGLFIEQVIGCNVGKKIKTLDDAKSYIKSIQSSM